MAGSVIQGCFPHAGTATVQRKGAALPPHAANVARGPGQPLPPDVRQKMESFFGQSFADVRVYVGPHAQTLGATAYTHGSDIHFGPGHYQPQSAHGQQLLARQLAHVVQQRAGRVRNPYGSGVAVVRDVHLDAEAERLALRAAIHRAPVQLKAPPRVAQPLKFGRFDHWYGRFMSYSDQEKRIKALEERLLDAVRDTVDYFEEHRSWMPIPNVLWTMRSRINVIRGTTYADNELDEIETELQAMMVQFDNLSSGWARIQEWRPTDPLGTITQGITGPRYGAVYVNSTMYDLRDAGAKRRFVNLLFDRFINYGFRYNAQIAVGPLLDTDANAVGMMEEPTTLERFGSCITFASAFVQLLARYAVGARSVPVIGQNDTVIVRVPNFIDRTLDSNIEYRGLRQAGYYVFTGHHAVKVDGINEYYDPMARSRYTSIRPSIECALTDAGHDRFDLRGPCRSMQIMGTPVRPADFHLMARPNRMRGGLATYELQRH